jgi:hypothetical protein
MGANRIIGVTLPLIMIVYLCLFFKKIINYKLFLKTKKIHHIIVLRFVLRFFQQYFNFKIFQEVVNVFFCFKTLNTKIFKAILDIFYSLD